ncbi:MAG: FliH/SctL family protein [Hyphomicrobiales bacterium]|nr:FliH/SctL family protein [Hyphomicrobiales bacterium]
MAETAKFLFDRNLEAPAAAAQTLERELRQEFEKELAIARAQEYERGRADALASLEAKIDQAVGQLVDISAEILTGLDKECSAIRGEAVKVALAASERLAGDLIHREPIKLLEALFAQCLEHLNDAPHIAIRVNDAFAEPLQQKVAATTEQRGFAGKIIVLGDPETQTGDCRIEWADGGISRNFEQLRASVAEIVGRYLSTRQNGAGEPEIPPKPANNPAPADDPALAKQPDALAVPLAPQPTQPNNAGEAL